MKVILFLVFLASCNRECTTICGTDKCSVLLFEGYGPRAEMNMDNIPAQQAANMCIDWYKGQSPKKL